ncbi:MAG TPA: hypothetical protein EYO73_08710 [Sulfurimonas sp.]|nr:hypothetical protein [Sulfurimonas sp.]
MIKHLLQGAGALSLVAILYLLYVVNTSFVKKNEEVYVENEELIIPTEVHKTAEDKKVKIVVPLIQENIQKEKVYAPKEVSLNLKKNLKIADPRTPKTVALPQGIESLAPSKEEVSDPNKFAQFEENLRHRKLQVFYPSKEQIQEIKDKIEDAQVNGTRTQEEIQEAQEAIEKLEQIRIILADEGVPEPS